MGTDRKKKKHCNWWCAACGGQYEWRAPNRILVVQIGVNANEAKVYNAHATLLVLSDNFDQCAQVACELAERWW